MELFCRPWNLDRRLANVIVVGFVIVQCLDGILTYLGVAVWGPAVEANPVVRSAVTFAGAGAALTSIKLIAIGCGIVLHLKRIDSLIAVLTAIYVAVAILPWTAALFAQ